MKPGTSRDVVVYFFMSFARLRKGNGLLFGLLQGFRGCLKAVD
jgi:hypothetical protein